MAGWDDAHSRKAAEAIARLQASIRFDRLGGQLATALSISKEKARDYIATLVHLSQARRTEGFNDAQLCDHALDFLRVNAPSKVPSADRVPTFTKFLATAVAPDSQLNLSAKALDLLLEQPRLYQDARIMTDVRPLFPEGAAVAPPVAGIITHTLRVSTFSKVPRENRQEFFTLDSEDLLELQRVVKRAIDKEAALRKQPASIARLVE